MSNPMESRIRLRAYRIWEEEGRPEGCDVEHWRRAEREITSQERTAPVESSAGSSVAAPSDTEETEGATHAMRVPVAPPSLKRTGKTRKS